MRHLDLFSGIGGFALSARWVGWETVGFCEIEPYCQKVLQKNFPGIPIYDDVRNLHGDVFGNVFEIDENGEVWSCLRNETPDTTIP